MFIELQKVSSHQHKDARLSLAPRDPILNTKYRIFIFINDTVINSIN